MKQRISGVIRKTKQSQRISLLLAALFLLIPSTTAVSLSFRGGSPKVNNQLFDPAGEALVTLTFTVTHKGAGLDYFVSITPGSSLDSSSRYLVHGNDPGAVMYYNLFKSAEDRTVILDFSDNPGSSQVISGTITDQEASTGPGARIEHSFVFALPTNQFPLAGNFNDTVDLRLYEGTPEAPVTGNPAATATVTMSTRMNAYTDLALVPTGGSFQTNQNSLSFEFGTLIAGNTREADLLVRANSQYNVSVRSVNGGQLSFEDLTDDSIVPYLFELDGQEVLLPAGVDQPLVSLGGPSDEIGDRYHLGVTILDYGMATEGRYSDTIHFTLSAP